VLIVQHLAPRGAHYLVGILARSSRMAVAWAEQGAAIQPGQVLVGPPDVHFLCADDRVCLSGGPRENHVRPSIDKLFRSAAAAYGSRVIGVLLTGMMDDGVGGLRAIRQAGGAVIVQDPMDAAYPELPTRALQAIEPDRTLRLDEIGGAIAALVGQPVAAVPRPAQVALEAAIDRRTDVSPAEMNAAWTQTSLSCPECHGPMWQLGDERARRFRCYLGHATTAHDLLGAANVEVEQALWSAVRALNDRASTLETLANDAERTGSLQSAQSYARRARETRAHAEIARKFMLDLTRPA
jgi:two-component system chemotaxis response regulator CheB